jgi:hypothetical protein
MKKVYSIISIAVLLCMASKCELVMDYDYPLYIQNNSDAHICFYIALGGNGGIMYPDTALFFNKEILIDIKPKTTYPNGRSSPIEELFYFINDTLSIYFFNKDTLDTYSWEIIQYDYKILHRYDLSLEDIYTLTEKKGPVIPYPPSEKMKDMKMYPPYGQ